MRNRNLTLLALAVLVLISLPTAAADKDIPRTASGRPDLSGNFDIAGLTPMERDPKYGEQLFMTPEEAMEIERMAAAGMAAADAASDPDRGAPPSGGDGSPGAAGAVGGYNAFWVDPGTKTYAIDGKFRTSILTDPPDGRLPAVSEAGTKRRSLLHPYAYENTGDAWWLASGDDPYDGPESLSLLDRCLYLGAASLPARPVLYNNLKTIVQTDDHILINIEWMHWARVVRMNAEHLPEHIRSLGGDSVGHWDGDTLVVDTANFLADTNKPRKGLHIVERFSRLDKDTVLYQFTVNDPDYEAPYSGEFPWHQTSDKNFEYACHEGNYALGNILRGARLLERETIAKQSGSGE